MVWRSGKFDHFAVPDLLFIYFKPDKCTHFVPALFTGGAGVHMKTLHGGIVHHF